jgi:hypothetical protein
VSSQVRTLGILWLALSLLRLLPALAMMGVGHWGWHWAPIPHFLGPLFGLLGGLLAIRTVLGVVTGVGLMNYQPWARSLSLVLGCLGLFDLPLGTALGIYTLWVMLSDGADAEYRRLCRPL